MKSFIRYLLVITLLLLNSCGVKQPIDTSINQIYGKIFVESGGISGAIYLDGEFTNKMSPDTLFNVPVGMHIIRLVKDGYKSLPDSIEIWVEENLLKLAQFDMEKLIQVGYAFIETIPAGGEIFIDDQTTGKFTPDTIQTDAALHQFSIKKNGYKSIITEFQIVQDSLIHLQETFEINQRILLETFGNVSCEPCVDAVTNLHNFIEANNPEDFALVEYFANWPNPNDPFFKEAPEDVIQRVMYYDVRTLPALRINGSEGAEATLYADIVSVYENVLANFNSSLGLSIKKQNVDGVLTVNIEIYNFNGSLENDQWFLFVAIFENDIHFNTPPGSNGLKDFDYVFRTFLSDKQGDPIQSNSNSIELEYSMPWSEWNYANSNVLAFIQNMSTKQIIQTSIK